MRRAVWIALASLTVLAALFLFVLPARIYLSQRHSLARTQAEITAFDKENTKLAAEIRNLRTNKEIERLARTQYGLVMPGEQAFAILPPNTNPPVVRPRTKGARSIAELGGASTTTTTTTTVPAGR